MFLLHFDAEVVKELAPKIKTRLANDDIYFKDKQEELIIECEADGNPTPTYVQASNKPKDSTHEEVSKFRKSIRFWKLIEKSLE